MSTSQQKHGQIMKIKAITSNACFHFRRLFKRRQRKCNAAEKSVMSNHADELIATERNGDAVHVNALSGGTHAADPDPAGRMSSQSSSYSNCSEDNAGTNHSKDSIQVSFDSNDSVDSGQARAVLKRRSSSCSFLSDTRSLGSNRSEFAVDEELGEYLPDLTGEIAREEDRPVAGGGYADVWRCTWKSDSLEYKVAIKALRVFLSDDETVKKKKDRRLRKEIRTWAQLDHPNIAPLYGVTYDYGPFAAMVCPWHSQGNLGAFLDRSAQPLAPDVSLSMMTDIAGGLKYLHDRRIVHGDLTGANVLLSDEGICCLCDFGLSNLLDELHIGDTSSIKGAVRWCAPELYRLDWDQVSPRRSTSSDIFSLASVFLQIFTRKVPYYGMNDFSALAKLAQGVLPTPPSGTEIPARHHDLLMHCWDMSPQARPSSTDVVHHLQDIKLFPTSSASVRNCKLPSTRLPALSTVSPRLKRNRSACSQHQHPASYHPSRSRSPSGPNGTAFDVGEDLSKSRLRAGNVNKVTPRRGLGLDLSEAAYHGRDDIVSILLRNGTNVDTPGARFGSALQAAVYSGKGHTVSLLLHRGADVDVQGGPYGNALQAALVKRDRKLVSLLLQHGADANVQAGTLGNALYGVVRGGDREVASLLLERGADVNVQVGEFGNALQAAAFGGDEKMVALLLAHGADVNAQGGICGSALQAAAYIGDSKIVMLLLQHGADVNAEGGQYGSALQAAVDSCRDDVVQLMLEHGAHTNAAGGIHGSALDIATRYRLVNICALLRNSGAVAPSAQARC